MKKITVSFISVLLTVLFCSCNIPAQRQECFSVPESFTGSFSFTSDGTEYSGTLQRENRKYTLIVLSPESMRGLCAVYENGEFSVSFGESGMSLKPQDGFFMKDIIEFIEDSSADTGIECEKKGGEYIIAQNGWSVSIPEN